VEDDGINNSGPTLSQSSPILSMSTAVNARPHADRLGHADSETSSCSPLRGYRVRDGTLLCRVATCLSRQQRGSIGIGVVLHLPGSAFLHDTSLGLLTAVAAVVCRDLSQVTRRLVHREW
jgi:hypothetical protein